DYHCQVYDINTNIFF
nr:immunoglobulin light chain junction region [Macaca mulatta]